VNTRSLDAAQPSDKVWKWTLVDGVVVTEVVGTAAACL
jgi:hypothetical protein